VANCVPLILFQVFTEPLLFDDMFDDPFDDPFNDTFDDTFDEVFDSMLVLFTEA
jgi:hypothetical protein